jgi:hypothetical protein
MTPSWLREQLHLGAPQGFRRGFSRSELANQGAREMESGTEL